MNHDDLMAHLGTIAPFGHKELSRPVFRVMRRRIPTSSVNLGLGSTARSWWRTRLRWSRGRPARIRRGSGQRWEDRVSRLSRRNARRFRYHGAILTSTKRASNMRIADKPRRDRQEIFQSHRVSDFSDGGQRGVGQRGEEVDQDEASRLNRSMQPARCGAVPKSELSDEDYKELYKIDFGRLGRSAVLVPHQGGRKLEYTTLFYVPSKARRWTCITRSTSLA